MASLHKVIGICAGALALSIMAVSCGPEKVPEPTPTPPNPSIPVEDIYLTAATRTKAITDPGATLAVEVDCNDEWDFALSEPYFMEVSRTKTELVLALDKERCAVRSIKERDESLENFYMHLIGGVRHA